MNIIDRKIYKELAPESDIDKGGTLEQLADEIFSETMLVRAFTYARAGKYNEAEQLLMKIPQTQPLSNIMSDLIARIRAQQGHLYQAEAIWTKLLRRDPGNQSYSASINRISKIQRRYALLNRIIPIAIGLCIIFLLLNFINASFN